MQRHLDAGCDDCFALCESWRLRKEAAEREAEFEPPESAVLRARGALARPGPTFISLPTYRIVYSIRGIVT